MDKKNSKLKENKILELKYEISIYFLIYSKLG